MAEQPGLADRVDRSLTCLCHSRNHQVKAARSMTTSRLSMEPLA